MSSDLVETILLMIVAGVVYWLQRVTTQRLNNVQATASTTQANIERALADANRRLDETVAARKADDAIIEELRDQLKTEREANIAYRASTSDQLSALKTTTDRQVIEIAQLTQYVTELRAERDSLKSQRDQSRSEAASLATELSTVSERLVKAEKQLSELSVEKRAFEILLDRLQIQVITTVKEIPSEPVPA